MRGAREEGQRPGRAGDVLGAARLGQAQRQQRPGERKQRRYHPHGVVGDASAQELSRERPQREPAPDRQPEQSQRQAAAILRGEVHGPGRAGRVDGSLARAHHQPRHDEHHDARGDEVKRATHRHSECAGHQHRAAPAHVRLPPRQWPANHGCQGERAHDDPDGQVAGVQRPAHVSGQHRQRGADREEGEQRGGEHTGAGRDAGMALGERRPEQPRSRGAGGSAHEGMAAVNAAPARRLRSRTRVARKASDSASASIARSRPVRSRRSR